MKRQRTGLIQAAIVLAIVVGLLLLFVFPAVSGKLAKAGFMPKEMRRLLIYVSHAQTWAMMAFVIAWIVFLGSCFASFLNVVAWRVPRGRGVNGSSHCPHCDVKLSMRDNVPIIGWLKNHGRCRNCKTPITIRYLIVELILGLITLLIVGLEVFGAGVNLPGFPDKPFRIIQYIIVRPNLPLIFLAGYHLVLLYALFTMSVVRNERLRIPFSIWAVAAVLGITLPFVVPNMQLVHWSNGLGQTSWQSILATTTLGLSAGVVVGLIVNHLPLGKSSEHMDAWEKDQGELEAKKNSLAVDSNVSSDQSETSKQFEPVDQALDPFDLNYLEITDHFPGAEETSRLNNTEEGETSEPPTRYRHVKSINESVGLLSLVGIFLGWQAVLIIASTVLLMALVRQSIYTIDKIPLAVQTFLTTVWFICCWRWIGWLTGVS